MQLGHYHTELKENGYCIIPEIINDSEIKHARLLFFNWKCQVPDIDKNHSIINPHGIFKFHEIGHQEHAWYLRTHPNIINVFKQIWNTDELVVSFDGTCYMPKDFKKKDNIWTHTDQASNYSDLQCYQSFVSLTDNQEKTLVVYEKSHLLHEEYFKEKNKTGKNWNLIEHDYLEGIKDKRIALKVNKGDLVIWDSRLFHQNQCGDINSGEERLVQYLCYLPKNNPKNNKAEQNKRLKYFLEKRTTSHWPYKINVNGLQPQTYGNNSLKIDYSKLPPINLDKYIEDIYTLI